MENQTKAAIDRTGMRIAPRASYVREALFDKLGEHAAHERSGVRLYQAMIIKVQVVEHPERTALLADLNRICKEEFQHFLLLNDVITELDADATAQTLCTDVSAVVSMGVMRVLADPRSTLAQCLRVLLSVEMTDKACWELLIELARQSGREDLVERFQNALASE